MAKKKTIADFCSPDYCWLDVELADLHEIRNPMTSLTERDIERPDLHLIRMLRDPVYFGFTCKHILNINLLPVQIAILQELWLRPFPMFIASRGFGKSFLLAVFATLKCLLIPGSKVVVVGSGFRQSKIILEYMETIWKNAPILQTMCNGGDGLRKDVDRWTMKINDGWVIAVPIGDGQRIRGLRAHCIIADEFASIPPQIYETVISGFASVSADPFGNVKLAAKRKMLKQMGMWDDELEEKYLNALVGNQSIITGTADYAFRHFAQYHDRYLKIIQSLGDQKIIEEIYNGDVPDNFRWDDYSVIRIPYELVPEGFMDDKQVARARATIHNGIYQMEYGAVFTEDSEGFFKRSLIESCVTSDLKPVMTPSGPVWFDPTTKGSQDGMYVYGIDPASENDNFTIVVLQLFPDHTRVVYSWATNRKSFKERQDAGLCSEHDYYGYCARKIRDLMKTFPPVKIGMDSQGGGVAVMEALHDPDKMFPGEQFIWPVINPDKEADTDGKNGLHIVELINFANAEWTGAANHGLRKDMEDKVLLFPRFDPVSIGLAIDNDAAAYRAGDKSRLYDSLEDCVMEIEALKDELCLIVMTKTPLGNRDRWDTPEIKAVNGKKGRLRKDRYSSLVIANMIARQIHRTDATPTYQVIGGAARDMIINPKSNNFYDSYGVQNTFNPDICQAIHRF